MIPETGLDRALPFAAWTVWIYLSQWVLLPLAVHLVASPEGARRLFRAMGLACGASFAVFGLAPTTVPRVGLDLSGVSGAALAAVHGIDPPLNCFPSLHVSLALVAGLATRRERPGSGAWALPWVCLIAVSTITTRQHLLIDVAGGLAVGALAWGIAARGAAPDRADQRSVRKVTLQPRNPL